MSENTPYGNQPQASAHPQPPASEPHNNYAHPLPNDLSQGWLPEDTRQTPTSPLPAPKLWGYQSLLPSKLLRALRHPGELPWLIVAFIFTVIAYLFVLVYFVFLMIGGEQARVITTLGLDSLLMQAIAIAIYLPLLIFFARGLLYASLRLRAVRITPTQFPEAYQMIVEASHAAGLRRVPDAYVQLGNGQINAFASGHGHRRFIAIYSDLFEIGGAPRNPEALRFVIGHEVGHIAAGHVSYFRLIFTSLFQQIPILSGALSRAQEYTADNFGYRFCPQGAPTVVGVLAAGKYLCNEVNVDELADRAVHERGFFTWLANLNMSHPPTTWRAHALRDRSEPGRLIWRPKNNPPRQLSLIPSAEPAAQWADPLQGIDFISLYPEAANNPHWGTVLTESKAPARERDRLIPDFLYTGWVPPHLRQQMQAPMGPQGGPVPAQPLSPEQGAGQDGGARPGPQGYGILEDPKQP